MFSTGNHPKKWLILPICPECTQLPGYNLGKNPQGLRTEVAFPWSSREFAVHLLGLLRSECWIPDGDCWVMAASLGTAVSDLKHPEASWKTRGLSTWTSWNMRISPTFWACFPPKWMSKQQHVGFYTGMTQVKLQNKGVGAGFQASCIHWKPWSNISLLSLPVGRFLFFFRYFHYLNGHLPGDFAQPSRILILGRPWTIYIHILPWYGSMGPYG